MTEQEIRRILREVLNEELKKYNNQNNGFVFDLSKIPKEELEKQYVSEGYTRSWLLHIQISPFVQCV